MAGAPGGSESRGFIFSAPLAYLLGAGLVPVRKLGKLPAETITVEYALEYGSNTLEIHARDMELAPFVQAMAHELTDKQDHRDVHVTIGALPHGLVGSVKLPA